MSSAPASLEFAVLGLGNPLLDMSVKSTHAVLDKYRIKPADACLAEPHHLPLYPELEATPGVTFVAGGATQNSIRVCQWMLQSPGATSYIGCVGKDAYAKHLRDAAEEAGVRVLYQEHDTEQTGTCAVLVVDHDRSLVANLAAANHYSVEHFKQAPQQEALERSRIIYSSGFFLTASPQTAILAAQHAAANNKIFGVNLAAPFVMHAAAAALETLVPLADLVFGNEHEAAEFGTTHASSGYSNDPRDVAARLSKEPKTNASRPRTVVITQGKNPTLVAINGEVTEFPVTLIPKSELVDTNGAGDAFVGGFLSQLALGHDVARCVAAGHYAAGEIVRREGCTFPPRPSFSA